jgi:hypothetical protein
MRTGVEFWSWLSHLFQSSESAKRTAQQETATEARHCDSGRVRAKFSDFWRQRARGKNAGTKDGMGRQARNFQELKKFELARTNLSMTILPNPQSLPPQREVESLFRAFALVLASEGDHVI